MDTSEFADLLERIKTEPSVLFLGQKYLASLDGNDFFVQALNANMANGRLQISASYQQVWELLGQGKLSETQFTDMARIVAKIPTQWWLRQLLSLGWGLVYTSAIDAALLHCVGSNFSMETISDKENHFRRKFMSKRSLHGIFLYGTVYGNNGEFPPKECNGKALRHLQKKINDRIQWIFNDILSEYGLLVIDGWDQASDWAESLLHNATAMPYHSIYLFGISESQKNKDKYIKGLIDDEILHTEERTFANFLAEYSDADEDEELAVSADKFAYGNEKSSKTIMLRRGKSKQPVYLDLSTSALDSLDGSVTVLHDEIGNEPPLITDKSITLANFLQPSLKPTWPLFNSKLGFYVDRAVDDYIITAVDEELNISSYKRKIIVIHGDSNSGKTTTLAKLALNLRDKHQYPVLFVSGRPSQSNFRDNLKHFIKTSLQKRTQGNFEGGADNVILIWDCNIDSFDSTIYQYKKMARDLMECNIVIVGSTYNDGFQANESFAGTKVACRYIPISAELTDKEIKTLEKVLEKSDMALYERFQNERVLSRKNTKHLLNLIQNITKFAYSPEWKMVAELLRAQFLQEVDVTERRTTQALEDYNQNEFEMVKSTIAEKGFAASWQIKLRNYQLEHSNDLRNMDDDEEYRAKLELQDDITLLNQVLAVAGQFYTDLPLSLLLRLIHKDTESFGRREYFLIDVLRHDSLIRYTTDEQGYSLVRFRNPGEAILYTQRNFGDNPQQVRQKEVELLCAIIQACRWNIEEGHFVIQLVRKFGPNSTGRYGQPQNHTSGLYCDYAQWWNKIAEIINETSEGDPEAVLVYAHFLREKYSYDVEHGNCGERKYLSDSAQALRDAIDRHSRENKHQYRRLLVEKCANLVASMSQAAENSASLLGLFIELQKDFTVALTNWDRTDEHQGSFSTNNLLDIWLNAMIKFSSSFVSLAAALADQHFLDAVSKSFFYVDRLFNPNTIFDSIALLNKIDTLYKWSDDRSITTIGNQLDKTGNDTYLYMRAWRYWLTGAPKPKTNSSFLDVVKYNLAFLPPNADRNSDLGGQVETLKQQAMQCAQQSITLLEGNSDLISKSKSYRCLEMMIKSKWLLYTKKLMLEEKQVFNLSLAQWQEIHTLCAEYLSYCGLEKINPFVPIRFINATYMWQFFSHDRLSEVRNEFQILRQSMGSDWFIERIGICQEDTDKLCHFYVDIIRNSSGTLTATIKKSLASDSKICSNIVGRKGIHISNTVLEYLFEDRRPSETYNMQKPVVLWFNAHGPTLGMPLSEKGIARQ